MLAKSNDQNTLNQDIKDINIKKLKIKYFKLYVIFVYDSYKLYTI